MSCAPEVMVMVKQGTAELQGQSNGARPRPTIQTVIIVESLMESAHVTILSYHRP